jgi:hypothetical protein
MLVLKIYEDTIKLCNISVDEKLIDNELAELYFRTTEGSKEEAALEKLIGASAIQDVMITQISHKDTNKRVGNRMPIG